MIDIDELYKHSMDFITKSEEDFYGFPADVREAKIAAFNANTAKYDLDNAHALWLMPNHNEYLFKVCKLLQLEEMDILLDIGAGDGRLSIITLQLDSIQKAIAIEFDKNWFDHTTKYFLKHQLPVGMTYERAAWQDFEFPKEITKCAFIAWHNGDKTKAAILEKLKKTNCELFVHNFGDQGVLQQEVLQ